jgi:phosphatidylglycerophosphatase A
MGFIQGEGRTQGTLFPVVLDDLVAGVAADGPWRAVVECAF